MTDERYKKIMADLGMPNSRSLLAALQQVANEVAQELVARLKAEHEKEIIALKQGYEIAIIQYHKTREAEVREGFEAGCHSIHLDGKIGRSIGEAFAAWQESRKVKT